MKRILSAALLALAASPALAQLSYYGRLDLVGLPRPEVIDPRPVSAERAVSVTPVYVRVRAGEEKHWKRNCSLYRACNVPVYFVRDDWYRSVYEPRYRQRVADEAEDRATGAAQAKRQAKPLEDQDPADDRYKLSRDAGRAAPLRPALKPPPAPVQPPQ